MMPIEAFSLVDFSGKGYFRMYLAVMASISASSELICTSQSRIFYQAQHRRAKR